MKSIAGEILAGNAAVLAGCALALLQSTAMAAPDPHQRPDPPASFVAPAWVSMPKLGRAHSHADGHQCEVVHAPVAPARWAPRPLPLAVHEPQAEVDKAARMRREQ